MTTITVGIMAHPARTEEALRLAGRTNARITWDRDKGEWDTASRAWQQMAFTTAQWSILLQDDALPIPDFHIVAAHILAHAPETAVGLYVGTSRPRRRKVQAAVDAARQQQASWLQADGLLWGPAIALPTHHITPMLQWAGTCTQQYDQRIADYYRDVRHRPVLFTWPSLVDHADTPSLLHPTDVPRHAHQLGAPRIGGPTVRIDD